MKDSGTPGAPSLGSKEGEDSSAGGSSAPVFVHSRSLLAQLRRLARASAKDDRPCFCGVRHITTYAPASRPMASWMEPRLTKVARVSAGPRGPRQGAVRPNQEKVRSTTAAAQ